ncbi:MAG: GAF domain-containing protein [Bacteroidales bacterium]|nr:GAF domain-containing protein [Bacteroidales bacterium]
MWVGSSYGISKFLPGNDWYGPGSFQVFRSDPKNNNSLVANLVWDIYSDSKDRLWIATGNGLSIYDEKTGSFKNFTASKTPGALSTNNIKCFAEDKQGRMWIGTEGGGLMYYSDSTGVFHSFTPADGLPSYTVYGMAISDNNKELWLSTLNGLSKMDLATFKIFTYSVSDGLQSNLFNLSSYAKNQQTGEMLFGGSAGLNIFDPQTIVEDDFVPQLQITNVLMHNQPIPIKSNEKGAVLNQSIVFTKKLDLKHYQNSFIFYFAATHYSSPENISYLYKLEGQDDAWVEKNNADAKAVYTNLLPGSYTFKVKATNCDGIWTGAYRELSIYIAPPFWKTWWFRILAALAVLVSFVSYYRYRVALIKRRNQELEAEVAERTKDLMDANTQLEERQQEIEMQTEEILAQRDTLLEQKEEITKAYNQNKLLSEFGQKITASLNIHYINQMIFEYVSSLMDTAAFGIGLYNEEKKHIEFPSFFENGKKLPFFVKELSSGQSLSVRCFLNKEEIVINNLSQDYKKYLSSLPEVQTSKMPESMIHLPLVVEKRTIGTITINSYKPDAYSENDLSNLRTLASYISIALDNAYVYTIVNQQNEHIRSGINYAQTIQKAILPLQKNMDAYFNSFVLFKPKDVVSGDFYWFAPLGERSCLIAVIDCTGHGVPGAFMSLIGNRLLNEIVNEKKIHDPAVILEELDAGIVKALKQKVPKTMMAWMFACALLPPLKTC